MNNSRLWMDSDLPDSMSVWWPETTIAEYVKLYVDLWKIDAVRLVYHSGEKILHLTTS